MCQGSTLSVAGLASRSQRQNGLSREGLEVRPGVAQFSLQQTGWEESRVVPCDL